VLYCYAGLEFSSVRTFWGSSLTIASMHVCFPRSAPSEFRAVQVGLILEADVQLRRLFLLGGSFVAIALFAPVAQILEDRPPDMRRFLSSNAPAVPTSAPTMTSVSVVSVSRPNLKREPRLRAGFASCSPGPAWAISAF